ncbi:MAG: PHP domain-containing protein [Chitinispirillia bacterium]|nr:PHP domain-containing protein [Chitinispirillia bacterium]MCL2268048.1 PHP domain-containing protein [Chitinispirillia bacterium]
MIQFDLHVHSIFSQCGIHTVLELLEQAKMIGMKGFAVTDHGLTLPGGRLNGPFFERFKSPCPDVKILKGVECNLLDENGNIDAPWFFIKLKVIDIVLLGIHPNTHKKLGIDAYTDMLIAAIRKNPCIDIITHPNDVNYPVDYKRLAREAKAAGVAVELNNSKIMLARADIESAYDLVRACLDEGCSMAVNSDTHAIHELGLDDSVRPILKDVGFPEELIVNRDEESALEFIESRRKNKVKTD